MAKRNRSGDGKDRKKAKFHKGGVKMVEPGMSGIYATCARRKEQQCKNELKSFLTQKFEEYYADQQDAGEDEPNSPEAEPEGSIEDEMAKELEQLRKEPASKTEPISFIDLGCECVVFIRTRKPIDPAEFVQRICRDALTCSVKNTRYTQRLVPVNLTATANLVELKKLALKILAPHFHAENQEPKKFAINTIIRNHTTLKKDEIIRTVAECVGNNHGHSVDLKNYDKMILVECFKSNVGMSVVDEFDSLQRFNLQSLFEKATDKHE